MVVAQTVEGIGMGEIVLGGAREFGKALISAAGNIAEATGINVLYQKRAGKKRPEGSKRPAGGAGDRVSDNSGLSIEEQLERQERLQKGEKEKKKK